MARKKSVPDMFDVVIAGGGYVGLSLAVALKQGDAGLTCAVVDPKPMEDLHKDPRASAIAAAERAWAAHASRAASDGSSCAPCHPACVTGGVARAQLTGGAARSK